MPHRRAPSHASDLQGLMWPLIDDHEGDWYPAGLPKKSMEGMEGYRVRPYVCGSFGEQRVGTASPGRVGTPPMPPLQSSSPRQVWTSSGLVFADGLYVICKLCVLFWLSRADRKQARKGGKLVAQRTLERRRERTRRISLGRASSADEGGLETVRRSLAQLASGAAAALVAGKAVAWGGWLQSHMHSKCQLPSCLFTAAG